MTRNRSYINKIHTSRRDWVAVVRSLIESDQPTLATQYFLSQLHRIK
ncbi:MULTISPECIES: hypothetical protein [Nostocales]|nr:MULTISPECIES: hypothetical protein [Nostocales]